MNIRQSDIASTLNVTREAVAQILRQFREEGIINTGYRSIRLIDRETLRRHGAVDLNFLFDPD